jgi:UDP-N-acetylglucosamine 2-epimerase (non-hydrolysing)
MKILSVVGTRPNFMKMAPLANELKKRKIPHVLVHTGQHYDKAMSQLFFEELELPKPAFNLGVGSGTFFEQVRSIVSKLDAILKKEKPDVVLVVGDVTSTFAGAFAARQLGIPVAHVEAGLRSFDFEMPEEVNRVLTDNISNYLFTTEESANKNLLNEGIAAENIHFVGNVMIDTLLSHRQHAKKSTILKTLGLEKKKYCVLTLHRPSNVDSKKGLLHIIDILEKIQQKIHTVFPIHPRTRKSMESFNLMGRIRAMRGVILTTPQGYLDFLCLMDNAALVLTDSGGIQEETTVLGTPCITLRNSTERPITLEKGTNLLVSTNKAKIISASLSALSSKKPQKKIIPLWDGKSAERIVSILQKNKSQKAMRPT